jgi:hypothetical protein
MYLRFGNYTHAVDEAAVVISKRRKINERGFPVGGTETWQIQGQLNGNSVSDLTTKIQALEAAYAKGGQDIYLLDDNYNQTAHYLRSSDTVSGVVATAIVYPFQNGAEYTTFRNYSIEVQASYDIDGGGGGAAGGQNNVVEFDQTTSWQGSGGPQFIVRTTRYGRPIYQQVARETPIMVQQTGSALGYRTYPVPPPPLYPNFEHVERRQITRQHPRIASREGEREFRINWSYSFTLVK